jgi:hypothetical protein
VLTGVCAIATAAVAVPAHAITVVSTTAHTQPYPLPLDAVSRDVIIDNTLCPALGVCYTLGSYQTADGARAAIETRVAGAWVPQEAPPTSDGAIPYTYASFSCASAVYSVAVGEAIGGGPIVTKLEGGVWSTTLFPGFAGVPREDVAVYGVSCPAPGWCAAVGHFYVSKANQGAWVSTLSDDGWDTHAVVVTDGDASSASLYAVACGDVRSCVAIGHYYRGSLTTYRFPHAGLIDTLTDDGWQPSHALSPDQQKGVETDLYDVVCPARGTCYVAGSYSGYNLGQHPFVAALRAGTWTGQTLPLPPGQTHSPLQSSINSISCPTPDWCAAVGSIGHQPDSHDEFNLFEVLSDGEWSAQIMPVPNEVAGVGGIAEHSNVQCPVVNHCLIPATLYGAPQMTGQVTFLDEFKVGDWSTRMVPVPGDAESDPEAGVFLLRCPAVDECVGTMSYFSVNEPSQSTYTSFSVVPTVDVPPLPVIAAVATVNRRAVTLLYNSTTLPAGWHDLGGTPLGRPAVVAVPGESGELQPLYFETGTDHYVYYRYLTGSWVRVSGAGQCQTTPAVSAAGSAFELACQGLDNHLHAGSTVIRSGVPVAIRNWRDLGGTLLAPPAVTGVAGVPEFFVLGTDDRIYRRTLSNGFQAMLAACSSGPTAATTPNRTASYLACAGPRHELEVWSNTGNGWAGPSNLGGALVGAPSVSANNAYPVFAAEGTDHATWARTPNGWQRVTGAIPSGVATAALN